MLADKKLSSSDYNSFGGHKKNVLNFLSTYGVLVLYCLTIALFIFNYFTIIRVKVLENELEVLKKTLDSVRLLDDNLVRDIISFEDEEDIDSYNTDDDPNIVLPDDGLTEYEYDTYTDELNENETNSDVDSYTKRLLKLTNYDDNNSKEQTSEATTKNNESTRRKRNIIAATDDGVVINSESYAEKKAKNISSRYNLRGSSSTRYPTRTSTGGTPWPVYPYSYSTAAYYRRLKPTKPTKAPNVLIRNSRVKHVEDKPKSSKQRVKFANFKSLDQHYESNEDTTTISTPFTIIRNRGHKRRSIKHFPSVHYSGDTSNYRYGIHDNFLGNDQLRHLNEMFVDWKATEWVSELKMHSHFTLDNGSVTVKGTGLYLVYAQIYYMDTHDRVGYRVYKNDKSILECAITSPSIGGSMKGNTCFTAGVERFQAGDKLSLRDIEQRISLFADGKSFFGMVKLGNILI